MSEEVWKSIEDKIKGHYLAAQHLPTSCPECAKARLDISPHDDPHDSDGLRNGVK
jgi:hypothetical protein